MIGLEDFDNRVLAPTKGKTGFSKYDKLLWIHSMKSIRKALTFQNEKNILKERLYYQGNYNDYYV